MSGPCRPQKYPTPRPQAFGAENPPQTKSPNVFRFHADHGSALTVAVAAVAAAEVDIGALQFGAVCPRPLWLAAAAAGTGHHYTLAAMAVAAVVVVGIGAGTGAGAGAGTGAGTADYEERCRRV